MSRIKQKVGECVECGNNGPLTAKRCRWCYWPHRAREKAKQPQNKAKGVQKQVFGAYFASQALAMPKYCEESGQLLPMFPAWLKKSCQAHILKKRDDFGFPSVAIHPQNMIFLHPDIHRNMDELGESYILKMKSLPLMRERVAILLPLLTAKELSRVPDYLLPST